MPAQLRRTPPSKSTIRLQRLSIVKAVEGGDQDKTNEKEGVAAVTVGILAPEPSQAAIEAAIAAADSSPVGSRPPSCRLS